MRNRANTRRWVRESQMRSRTDDGFLAHGNAPSVPARHSDRLTHYPVLTHTLAGNPESFGYRLTRLKHADSERKGIGPDMPSDRLVEGLELLRNAAVHGF